LLRKRGIQVFQVKNEVAVQDLFPVSLKTEAHRRKLKIHFTKLKIHFTKARANGIIILMEL